MSECPSLRDSGERVVRKRRVRGRATCHSPLIRLRHLLPRSGGEGLSNL
jgi:hypothetical protein